jgi:hypothetical protein
MKTHLRLIHLTTMAEISVLKSQLKKGKIHPRFIADIQKEVLMLKGEVRAIQIARGFLRGLPLAEIERPHRPYNKGHISSKGLTRTSPEWAHVLSLVTTHAVATDPDGAPVYVGFASEQELLQRFSEFMDLAFVVEG